jgi:hypothetical protein
MTGIYGEIIAIILPINSKNICWCTGKLKGNGKTVSEN